ncbi:MAG: glycosyltransferase family 2 protein [Deltaproteobacteria bacterium]|nr:glycosyltransferase family 2 protein [Deltaproteobacteria bacterium]
MATFPSVSLVIPLFNEEESIDELVREVVSVLDDNRLEGEVIVVDDGSRDRSWEKLLVHAEREPRLKLVQFRRNFGQTAALVAGMDHAVNDVIIPLDADLQNDPRSIPGLLEKISEGFDVVSGWRKNRQDAFFSRTLPSRIANAIISSVSGVVLHDYGCTLKAYRREVLAPVKLYGEMHRFIPIYASWAGARVTEVAVNHRARKYGRSKYGIGRTFKVVLDLLTVKFLGSYGTKPIYFFGSLGFALCSMGTLAGGYTLYQKFFHDVYAHRNPLLSLAVFMFGLGVQSLFLGLLAEIGIRTYHESQHRPIYWVRERRNVAAPGIRGGTHAGDVLPPAASSPPRLGPGA